MGVFVYVDCRRRGYRRYPFHHSGMVPNDGGGLAARFSSTGNLSPPRPNRRRGSGCLVLPLRLYKGEDEQFVVVCERGRDKMESRIER